MYLGFSFFGFYGRISSSLMPPLIPMGQRAKEESPYVISFTKSIDKYSLFMDIVVLLN
jgi:hypothetical protein